MLKKSFLIGAVALALSTGALARGSEPVPVAEAALAPTSDFAPGIYLGAQVGYDLSGWKDINGLQMCPKLKSRLLTSHTDGLAERFLLGYDINKNFAIEAGWFYVNDQAKITKHITDNGFVVDNKLATITTQAFDLSGKMKLPLNEIFDLYGKLGLAYLVSSGLQKADQIVNNNQTWLFSKDRFNTFSAVYGLGINYNITPNVIADLSWTQIYGKPSLNSNDQGRIDSYQPSVNFFSLGLAYKFNI